MPYTWSEEEELIQKVVREFAQGLGLDAAADRDRHDRFPEAELASSAGLGLCGLSLTADEGGAGAGPTAMVLALDEVAQVDPAFAAVLATHNAFALPIARAKPALLPAAVAGGLVAVAATEEAHGSDKSTFGTTAVPTDDGWTITGQKVWCLGAEKAQHFLVIATTPDGPAWFHVPAGTDGLVVGRNEPLIGLRSAGIRTVYFDVHVPADAKLDGDAQALLSEARAWHQVAVSAVINGAVAGAFHAASRFAETRVQFGNPIATYQAVSDAVTDIDVGLEASRALTAAAAGRLDKPDAALWAARAKLFATQQAIPLTRRAIRVQGGTGFMREGGTERFARDVRALQFMGEPSVVQRNVMKEALLDV